MNSFRLRKEQIVILTKDQIAFAKALQSCLKSRLEENTKLSKRGKIKFIEGKKAELKDIIATLEEIIAL